MAAPASRAQAPAPEQGYLVQVWQTEHGLPENIVNAIAQTPDGYLWCGTTHGLARFDGMEFKVFNGLNSPPLGSARIRQLFVDRAGTLWIAVFEGGLIRYFNGQFTAYSLPPRESTARTIFWMAEDESGGLWVTVEDGAVFHFSDGKFRQVSKNWDAGGGPARFRVQNDSARRSWVTTPCLLALVHNGELEPVVRGTPGEFQFLCPSRMGGWWIQEGGRLRRWQDGKWVADAGPWMPPDRVVECCIEDHIGRVWVGSLGRGIFCYSTNEPVRQLTIKDGLGSDLVRVLFEDSEGNIWAGTRSGGLNRLRPALFKTYGKPEGLASDLVTAVCEGQNGDIWVGTDGYGVNRISGKGIDHYSGPQGLDAWHIRALEMDHEGTIWVGSWPASTAIAPSEHQGALTASSGGGLFRLEKNQFAEVGGIPGRDTPVAALFEDSRGTLWLGQRTMNRLARLKNGVASAIDLPNSAPALDVTVMTEDASGNLWVGTDGNGLFCCNGAKSQRFARRDGLPSDTIRALYAESTGSIWIGTVDGGVTRLKNGRFVTCTTRNGLVDDVVNYITEDRPGFFWMTSFQGVFRVSKAALDDFADGKRNGVECMAFGKSDGLPALECPGGFQPAGCRASDGRLWFPTIKGLVVVNPAEVPAHSAPPRVMIDEVRVDAEAVDEAGSLKARIRPGNHRYEFHYTGLSFTAPERVGFRHKLLGFEKDWVDSGTQRSTGYSLLPPGDYEFLVNACNQTGVWSEATARFAMTVLPYFWQTWWFGASMILLAVAGAGAAFFNVRRRWQRRLKRVQLQLTVETERSRIAQDIHDGVGANLTEIAWLAEVVEKEATNPQKVRAQASKISDTARQTVQSFEEIVWAVLPENDTLESLIEYMGRRVDEMFDGSEILYHFSAPDQLPHVTIAAEIRHSFYLACKEALHNVSKHSMATSVVVEVTVRNNQLCVLISDNGCGFAAAADGPAGNGLRNMRQRLRELSGEFNVQTGHGQGTRISMSIPLRSSGRG
jgi:ligand-binding sensor domain-containing protein/signal transduction histidine kinase